VAGVGGVWQRVDGAWWRQKTSQNLDGAWRHVAASNLLQKFVAARESVWRTLVVRTLHRSVA
jgi:hypothetical protein